MDPSSRVSSFENKRGEEKVRAREEKKILMDLIGPGTSS